MARKKRIHFSGALYHVMLRGNLGQKIFFSDLDRKYFYSLLADGINRYTYNLHAFCLMNNHIHLAVQVSETSLSKIMHDLAFRYAQWINAREKRKGHLFQGRYKAILVESDSYIKELVRYIHLNPIRAKIVSTLSEYKWSSNEAYLGGKMTPWVNTDWVLSLFSENKSNAIKNYITFMGSAIDSSLDKTFITGNQKGIHALANDDFVRKLSECSNKQNLNTILTLEKLIGFVTEYYAVSIPDIQNSSKCQAHCKVRSIIGLLAKKLDIGTLTSVANYFNRDISSLVHSMRRQNKLPGTQDELSKLSHSLKLKYPEFRVRIQGLTP